ncbi:MAG: oxidoreductase [Legionellales bacterium]
MGKGTVLRVLEETLLPPAVTASLNKLLPDYKLEYFTSQPDYRRSYKHRIESLHKSFLFILRAYPAQFELLPFSIDTVVSYVAECKDLCNMRTESVADLQSELERFTANIVEVLSVCWRWPEGQELTAAIACLNEAEQYVLMGQGRANLATLMPMQGENKYVLQVDESIPPHYPLWLDELRKIQSLNYPKTPAWFRLLADYQQAYFCNLDPSLTDPKDTVQDLDALIQLWALTTTESLNLSSELKQINNDLPPYPAWFDKLSLQHRAMFKILSAEPFSIAPRLDQFKTLMTQNRSPEFLQTMSLVVQLPEWYLVLSDWQQHFLEHTLKQADRIEDAVSFLSSRLRTLPAPANYAAHSLYLVNSQGGIELLGKKRIRSSHIGSREALNLSWLLQQRHSSSNLAKVMEFAGPGQLRLMQTLISPIHMVKFVPRLVAGYLPLPPDSELFSMARSAVAQSSASKVTLQHNHPFNLANRIYYTSATDEDSIALLSVLEKYVADNPDVQTLLSDYKTVLESPFWDYVGRELFLSSLEQLIVLQIGGYSYGSCVSGKDRKAVELIHTDAMMLYKKRYGCWPKFGTAREQTLREQEERMAFITLVVDLYVSRHQQIHAGQNAPGSDGIKTPDIYFSKDIAKAINQRLGSDKSLEYDDRLATNNEVKHISKNLHSHLLAENRLFCRLMAKQIGERNCTRLYDALVPLINEKERFKVKREHSLFSMTFFGSTFPMKRSTPTGIGELYDLIHDRYAGNNVKRFEAVFAIILSRPERDETRTPATNSVYDRIRDLLRVHGPEITLPVLIEHTINEWGQFFNDSKIANRLL